MLVETYAPVIGGGETQARTVAEGLHAMGVPVTVLTRRSDAAFPAEERIGGVPVVRIGPEGPGHLKKWAMLPRLFLTLVRLRRSYGVILVGGYRVTGIAAVPAARLLGKRVVLKADNNGEMDGSYFIHGAKKLGIAGAKRLVAGFVAGRNAILKRADGFISISSAITREMEQAGVPSKRIVTIPNSVDTSRFQPASDDEKAALRERFGLPRDAVITIFTGRLLKTKGVLELARAWAALAPDHPEAHLVIVGSASGLMHDVENELQAEIAASGIEGSVTRTGFVTNVQDYLRASDVFVFPTYEEAFGISLIEAMAAGLPALATTVGGIPDIIEPEVNGLLMPPGEAEPIEAGLRRLLGDRDLRARLGAAAARTVEERYTSPSVVTRYAELLENFPPRRGPRPAVGAFRKS